jgi:hypothetical protein
LQAIDIINSINLGIGLFLFLYWGTHLVGKSLKLNNPLINNKKLRVKVSASIALLGAIAFALLHQANLFKI